MEFKGTGVHETIDVTFGSKNQIEINIYNPVDDGSYIRLDNKTAVAVADHIKSLLNGLEWQSFVSNPPTKDRVGDIFEIDSEHFEHPILAKLECDANGRYLFFVDMHGSSFGGYLNYREVAK